MKQLLVATLITVVAFPITMNAQHIDPSTVKSYEHQLDDVMEMIAIDLLKSKLSEVERNYSEQPTELNKVRLGIIYHETTLNLSFFSDSGYKGYAQKSFKLLDELYNNPNTTSGLMPFIASYRASALSLVAAETNKIKYLNLAFELFEKAVSNYAAISYLPEFLRGSVAENLPWFFLSKRKFATHDLESIILKQRANEDFANWKIMSFTLWGWANQHQGKKDRSRALQYLDQAIALDPHYKAGRERAEALKKQLLN